MKDILIIGAGPAGLTAAVYAIRAGLSVAVFDKALYGGQIAVTSEVENYPAFEKISGPELAGKIYSQAVNLGAEILFEEVIAVELSAGRNIILTPGGTHEGKTVIICAGVQRRKLNCPGEEQLTGRGVSYCATCDGAFYKGLDVAVVGGGNTALEDALFLSNLCRSVHLVHRRDTFRAQQILTDAALEKENIIVHYHSTVESIDGDSKVSSILVRSGETSAPIEVQGVFIAIGLEPNNEIYRPYIEVDENGYIVAGEACTTKIPGVYAAGDCRQKDIRQILTAAADGAVAACAAAHYLNTHVPLKSAIK